MGVHYGCPVCGFESENAEDVRTHLAEQAEEPAHQNYDQQNR